MRRKRRVKAKVETRTKEQLLALYGEPVLDTRELAERYIVTAIIDGGTVVVRSKDADGIVGSFDFQNGPPTLYYHWRPAPTN